MHNERRASGGLVCACAEVGVQGDHWPIIVERAALAGIEVALHWQVLRQDHVVSIELDVPVSDAG